jgi:hypothetical protein
VPEDWESTVPDVVAALVDVARQPQMEPLEERLAAAGWSQDAPGSGGLNHRWRRGNLVATQYGRGPIAFVEVTMLMAWPDSEDPDSEDRLMTDFEGRFERAASIAQTTLGPAHFHGSYGEAGFPEDVDAVMTASWSLGGGLRFNLMHEDSGVPFRLTATAN